MKIYFKVVDRFELALMKQLETNGYTVALEIEANSIYFVDTELKTVSAIGDTVVPRDYIVIISSADESERFMKAAKGEELARFNSGKPEFSYIDFDLFHILTVLITPNELDYGTNIYLADIITTLSAICFDRDVDANLDQLKISAYKLALLSVEDIDSSNNGVDLRAFESMAFVLMHGAKKYDRNNWRKPTSNPLSIADSLYRHVRDIRAGEVIDKDSGLSHIGHIMCNVMFLTYHLTKKEDV